MPRRKQDQPVLSEQSMQMAVLALKLKQQQLVEKYRGYQNDPEGYFHWKFPGMRYSPDMIRVAQSVSMNPVTGVRSANSTGKCVAFGSIIYLANGTPVRAEYLIGKHFGVVSVDPNLKRRVSTAYAADNGVKPVVRIETQTGKVILRTENHPLVSAASEFANGKTPKVGEREWKNAADFREGDLILCPSESGDVGSAKMDMRHVRLLAYLIGDGGLMKTAIRFSQEDNAALAEFRADAESLGCRVVRHSEYDYRILYQGANIPHPIHALLRENGMWNKDSFEKHVPDSVYRLDNEHLRVFLSRLYATDGSASVSEGNGWGKSRDKISIDFTSVSERLVRDVQHLLTRFGIVSKVRRKKTTWVHNGERRHGIAYCCDIYSADMAIKFAERIGIYGKEVAIANVVRVARERSRLRLWASRDLPEGYHWEKVVSVTPFGEMPTVAISVPGDNTYLTDFVEHNTHLAGSLIKWFVDCFSAGIEGFVDSEIDQTGYPLNSCEVYTSAAPPDRNLVRVWSELQTLQVKYPAAFDTQVYSEKYTLRDFNGRPTPKNFIEPVTIPANVPPAKQTERFTGKHAVAMLFLLDEANSVPEPIWDAIRECMTSGIVTRLVFFFNPRETHGPAIERFKDGRCFPIEVTAFTHPNVTTGRLLIPGAVTQASVLSLMAQDTRPLLPDEEDDPTNTFVVPRELIGKQGLLPDGNWSEPIVAGHLGKRVVVRQAFNYMVLGRPPKTSALQLIPPDWIAEARARWNLYVSTRGERPPVFTEEEIAAAAETGRVLANVAPIGGLDVAETQDMNVFTARWGGYFVQDVWEGYDLKATQDKAAELYWKHECGILQVDATGLGAGVAPNLTPLGINAEGVKVASSPTTSALEVQGVERIEAEFKLLRDQILWAVREWLQPFNGAMLPPDDLLLEEMAALTYEKTSNGKYISVISTDRLRTLLKRSPDRLMSLALTFAPDNGGWGFSVELEEAA